MNESFECMSSGGCFLVLTSTNHLEDIETLIKKQRAQPWPEQKLLRKPVWKMDLRAGTRVCVWTRLLAVILKTLYSARPLEILRAEIRENRWESFECPTHSTVSDTIFKKKTEYIFSYFITNKHIISH